LNFKNVQTLWEKSGKFYLDLTFTTVNLVGHTSMQDYELSIQVDNMG
jgi:hypothetical protein